MQADPRIGERVQLAPHLDRWMMGDRFGVIVARGRNMGSFKPGAVYRVRLDRSGKTLRFYGEDLNTVN